MTPNRPEHADKVTPVAGVSDRITVQRHLAGYAYAANGNLHNPTPRYTWITLVDGRDASGPCDTRRAAVEFAREYETDLLAEFDARPVSIHRADKDTFLSEMDMLAWEAKH